MPDSLVCARCKSDAVIPRLRVVERAEDGSRHNVELEVQRRPNAVFFKRPERTALWAQVCGACGHAEFYADAPQALYAAWLEADANPAVSAVDELQRTREALADSQLRLEELEEKLAFVEQLLERNPPPPPSPQEPP